MTSFDHRNPDYTAIYVQRIEALKRLQASPRDVSALKAYYRDHIADFINDWGMTSDPRLLARRLPSEIPFILFPRQRELLAFFDERIGNREPGIVEKSRDCGASWIVACHAAAMCLLTPGVVVGIGSRKEDALDRPGDPATIFWKIRFFLNHLPPEFRGSWDESRHSAHCRITFPDSPGSAIIGEAGDNIGRGGRSTVFFIDEAAFLERPGLIEASLASNTDTRIDISTPNGRANAFAQKRWSGKIPVFTFAWRDDPRKDDDWYRKQQDTLDPVTLAQEVDLSYDASVEGILIPAEWVRASIGAHTKLSINPTGERRAALDVADEGKDKNALAGRHGVLLEYLSSWSGKDSNIYATTIRAINACDKHRYAAFDFDSDGLGAGVRGDAVSINEKRTEHGKPAIEANAFRGSAGVVDPDGSMVEGRLNKDYFANLKAQAWWALRLRFQNTYRAVVEGLKVDPDAIISIDPALPERHRLVAELSQPTYSVNPAGKILVDKTPEGAMSPNLADAVMMCFANLQGAAYFAMPPSQTAATETVKALPLPTLMDYVFAVVTFVDAAAAVIFVAANRPDDGTRGHGFFVLDWDLRMLDAAAADWMTAVILRLQQLRDAVGNAGTRAALFVDSTEDGWSAWLKQRAFPVQPVGEDLPPVAERFAGAQPYVRVGLVQVAKPAHERTATFHGSTRNFLRELLSGDAAVNESNALAVAFATAVLTAFRGREAVPEKLVDPVDWSPHTWADSPPSPPPMPTVLLSVGAHVIDGHRVQVIPTADNPDTVWYPLPPGRHVIDDKLVIVHPVGGGVRIAV